MTSWRSFHKYAWHDDAVLSECAIPIDEATPKYNERIRNGRNFLLIMIKGNELPIQIRCMIESIENGL